MISVKELKEKLGKSNYDLDKLTEDENSIFNKLSILREHKGKLVKSCDNKFYLIIEFAINTETEEELVIYRPMNTDYKKYAMPIDMFLSKFKCIELN